MNNLTENEIMLIESEGGMFMDDERSQVRFDSYLRKPAPKIKKLLREKGYKITNKSCSSYSAYRVYVRDIS